MLSIDQLLHRREDIAPSLGELVIDHLVRFGSVHLSVVDGHLYASDESDVVDLVQQQEDIALQILVTLGATDEELSAHITRRERRALSGPSPSDGVS